MLNIDKLEQLIKERGWSNSYFCRLFDHSKVWINDMKRGVGVISDSDSLLAEIADKLDTTVAYLTDKTEQKEKPDTVDGIELSEQEWDIINFFREASPEVKAMMVQISKTK